MASLSPTNLCNLSFFLTSLLLISAVSAVEFRVGGPRGWMEPTGNETETYNHWAMRNRFHIGDTLYFKYMNDSVLMVDLLDYTRCNISNPIHTFSDGNTTFQFNRYGFFYFVSGKPGHCKSGQKLVVRVMVHPEIASPGPAPFPGGGQNPGSGSASSPWGPIKPNSSSLKLIAGSSVIIAILGGVLVVLLFV